MTSEQFQRLCRIYNGLESLCERFDRRCDAPSANNTFNYLSKKAWFDLAVISARFTKYADFRIINFDDDDKPDDGAVDELATFVPYLREHVENRLDLLANETMDRRGHAPGSIRRLSPLFARMIARERREINRLKTLVHEFANREQSLLNNLKSERVVVLFPGTARPSAVGV